MANIDGWPLDAEFALGDMVQKKGRASWRGEVVGWYRTDLTALGLAVENYFEPGSVQIYPQTALEAWPHQSAAGVPTVETCMAAIEAQVPSARTKPNVFSRAEVEIGLRFALKQSENQR